MTKSEVKALSVLGAIIVLVVDVNKANEHKKMCHKCMNRDYVKIMLDVFHLLEITA